MTVNPPTGEQPLAPYYYEDEVSLLDLWRVLHRRRRLVALVTALTLLAGLAFLWLPPRYDYTTTIEIGTRITGTKVELVESPETVLAKVQESYIPLARQELRRRNGAHGLPEIRARVPKGSQLVVLSSRGPLEAEELHTSLQQAVVDKLKADHARILGVLRKETEIQKQRAQAQVAALADEIALLQARKKRLEEKARLLDGRIAALRTQLERLRQDRRRAAAGPTDAERAMTLLLLDSQIQKQEDLLAQLREARRIGLAEEADSLEKALADKAREQAAQKDLVAKLDLQLANLRETRALLPPLRSPDPSGPGPLLVFLLALVLGPMLGALAAFLAEFLAKARRAEAAEQA